MVSHRMSSVAPAVGAGESNPRDIVARIYREELLKLAELAQASGNMAEYSMYERELERLSQRNALIASEVNSDVFVTTAAPSRLKDGRHAHRVATRRVCKANGSVGKVSSDGLDLPQKDNDCPEDLSTGRASRDSIAAEMKHSATDFSLPRSDQFDCSRNGSLLQSPGCDRVSASTTPAHMTVCGNNDVPLDSVKVEMQEPESEDSKSGSIASVDVDRSPLDLMQNIADSVVNKSQKKSSGSSGSLESSRHSLPPITSEQLKRCANLNTEDIVVAVRSTLADYSISQRLFGEAVLGLSQVAF
jgi:CUT domain